jgi:hypothetical protein
MNGKALNQATHFHPWLGPLLWVVYAGLSSYLLLSCLVAVLSHSFKDVADDETSEVLFKKVQPHYFDKAPDYMLREYYA